MFNIGPTELIVILVIALMVFGPTRLPDIGRTVGKSLREFRRATDELKDEFNLSATEDLPADRPAPGEPGYENWRNPAEPRSSGNGRGVASSAVAASVVVKEPVAPGPAASGGDRGTVEDKPEPLSSSAGSPASQGEGAADGDAGQASTHGPSWAWWPDKPSPQSREEAGGGQAG